MTTSFTDLIAFRLLLGGELAKHAISEGTKAITKVRKVKEVRRRVDGSPVPTSVYGHYRQGTRQEAEAEEQVVE